MVDIQNCFIELCKAAFYQVQRDAQRCGTKWTDKVIPKKVYMGKGFKNAISETPQKSAIT